MIEHPVLAGIAVACLIAALIWGRSSRRLLRASRRIEAYVSTVPGVGQESADLARSAFRKELHTTLLYALLAVALGVMSASDNWMVHLTLLVLAVPILLTYRYGPRFLSEARLAEERTLLERRAEEVLAQEELAPMRWAARLAPEVLPTIEGFDVGRVYEPGTGAMAGDFYDVHPTASSRLAVVIGDVAGHGIEPSITAFQVKYLLRVFLRQYRDPAQALEELNTLMYVQARPEELVSLCTVVFDQQAGTLRYASAGHPAAWLWHDGEVRPLRSTGPLLALDPNATFVSREIPLEHGDVLVLYTDGLTEARAGEQLFGEERVAGILRRDPGQDVTALCKTMLEAARDFSAEPLTDDVAILAIRRT